MTADDLVARALELAAPATPGPWRFDNERWVVAPGDERDEPTTAVANLSGRTDRARAITDAAFIVWCRNGVPALVARIGELEAQLRELGSQHDG